MASAFRPINDASGVVGTSKSIGGGHGLPAVRVQTVELIVESFLRLCPKPIVNTGENDYEVVTPVHCFRYYGCEVCCLAALNVTDDEAPTCELIGARVCL